MKSSSDIQDLVILVADHDMKATVEALLTRQEALKIRSIRSKVFVHPDKDGGTRSRGVDYLAPFADKFRHAMILFDHEGCGKEDLSAEEISRDLEKDLETKGFGNRGCVVVIEPELEAWVWGRSKVLDQLTEWNDTTIELRKWVETNFEMNPDGKPVRPKEALQEVIRQTKLPFRGSAFFRELAKKMSWKGCTDPSFQKFLSTLQKWFGTFP